MPEYNIQYEVRAKEIINDNKYMVLSTSDKNGDPWGTALFYTCDEKYNFYFYSNSDSSHCTNILQNPNVSLTIFNQESMVGSYDGVQIKGQVSEVTDTELPETILRYFKKITRGLPTSPSDLPNPDEFKAPNKLRFFKVTILKIYFSQINGRIEVTFNNVTGKWI
jgi:uncharacterized protein YhbP (UPF0306 family)